MVRRRSRVRVPERASTQNPCIWASCVVCIGASPALAGTRRVRILGLAGIRGQARRLVSPCDTPHGSDEAARSMESPCIRALAVAFLGKDLTPSLEGGAPH